MFNIENLNKICVKKKYDIFNHIYFKLGSYMKILGFFSDKIGYVKIGNIIYDKTEKEWLFIPKIAIEFSYNEIKKISKILEDINLKYKRDDSKWY